MHYLDKKYIDDIQKLNIECNTFDNIDISIPLNEEDSTYFLKYEASVLVSFLCLYKYDDYSYECIALTKPDLRNKGLFSYLFKSAKNYIFSYLTKEDLLKDSNTSVEFIFNVYENSKSAIKTLKQLDAKLLSTELMMRLDLAKFNVSCNKTDKAHFKFKEAQHLCDFNVYNIYLERRKIGKFALINFKSYTYFNSFEIRKKYRNLGYGKQAFIQLLEELKKKNILFINLQVEQNNIPALKIYTELGFEITTRLHTYYLDVFL